MACFKPFQSTGDMADCSVKKREATIFDSDHQSPNKRLSLDRSLNESDNVTTPNFDVAMLLADICMNHQSSAIIT